MSTVPQNLPNSDGAACARSGQTSRREAVRVRGVRPPSVEPERPADAHQSHPQVPQRVWTWQVRTMIASVQIVLTFPPFCLTGTSALLFVTYAAMRSPRRTTWTCTCVYTAGRGRTSVTSVAKPSGHKVILHHCEQNHEAVLSDPIRGINKPASRVYPCKYSCTLLGQTDTMFLHKEINIFIFNFCRINKKT